MPEVKIEIPEATSHEQLAAAIHKAGYRIHHATASPDETITMIFKRKTATELSEEETTHG
jgi:hypothetical protein